MAEGEFKNICGDIDVMEFFIPIVSILCKKILYPALLNRLADLFSRPAGLLLISPLVSDQV